MEATRLKILCANDVYIDGPSDGRGGWETFAAAVEKFRDQNTIVALAGDVLGGGFMTTRTKGQNVIDILNQINIDVATLGNHEFDFGAEGLRDLVSISNFPWLGANVYETATEKMWSLPQLKAFCVLNFGSLRVGVLGVVTEDTPFLSWPGTSLKFVDPIAKAITITDHLLGIKESEDLDRIEPVDLVIAITHLSEKEDISLATATEGKIAAIIGGHDHHPIGTMIQGSVGSTLIFKTGMNAYWLGVLELDILCKPAEKPKIYHSWKMVALTTFNFETPRKVLEIVNKWKQLVEKEEDEKNQLKSATVLLQNIPFPLDTRSAVVRVKSSAFPNLVADAMKWASKSDIAVINGGFIRGDRIYPIGSKLTENDICKELPFLKKISTVELRGKDFVYALEQHLRHTPTPNGVLPHPSDNLSIKYCPSNSPLSKIQSVLIRKNDQWIELDQEELFTVSVTEFLSRGGDGVNSYLNGKIVDENIRVLDAVITFLHHINHKAQDSWTRQRLIEIVPEK